MKKNVLKILYRVTSFLMAALLFFEFLFPFVSMNVYASETTPTSYDKTNIEDDLAGMDLTKYPKRSTGSPELIAMMEYCYSTHSSYAGFYNLYFYVYNPTCSPIDVHPENNVVNISIGDNEEKKEFNNISLIRLDYSNDFLFYKFKLQSTEGMLEALSDEMLATGSRTYEVTSIQLKQTNGTLAKDNAVKKKYVFSGYAAYCDENKSEISTLECNDFGAEAIHLEVRDTYYRFENKDDNISDQLNSVYFSIPEEYYDSFGNLSQVKAEWYEYKTAPIFVTKNSTAYVRLYDKLNSYITYPTNLNCAVVWDHDSLPQSGSGVTYDYYKGFYGVDEDVLLYSGNGYIVKTDPNSAPLNYIKWLFYVDTPTTQSDWTVSSDQLKEYVRKFTNYYCNSPEQYLLGKYAKSLFCTSVMGGNGVFNSIDEDRIQYLDDSDKRSGAGHVVLTFGDGDSDISGLDYLDKYTSNNFWDAIFNYGKIQPGTVEPFRTIIEGHLVLSDEDFSKEYFVNLADVPKLKEYAKSSYEKGERPILMRFAVTDYYSCEASFLPKNENGVITSDIFRDNENNGYVAQETVFLNFDVISLSFTDPDGKYVKTFGVVADPIDIINAIEAPEGMENEILNWLTAIVGLIVLVIILVVVMPIVSPILHAIWDIFWAGLKLVVGLIIDLITLPFRLIVRLFSGK